MHRRIIPLALSGDIVPKATFSGRPGRGVPTGKQISGFIIQYSFVPMHHPVCLSRNTVPMATFAGERSSPLL